ncbi:TY-Chap domain-containing protein [Nocardia sp. NPDC088792]|uniref:TY-Chap domain-containing protein n=1 Tax=Nocardia sp. NPDC088792 TaxID=3364332 RepID=UPI003829AAA7
MGTRGHSERVETTDWDVFAGALTGTLARLPSRANLILAASGNRYVQFQAFDIRLSAELTGNYYLVEPISESAAERLRSLGWIPPALQHEIENWHRTLHWPIPARGLEDLARSATLGLHDALGVNSPDELRVTGWSDPTGDLDLSALSAATPHTLPHP